MKAARIRALLEAHLLDERTARQFRCRHNGETKLLEDLLERVSTVPGLFDGAESAADFDAIEKRARRCVRREIFPKALALWR